MKLFTQLLLIPILLAHLLAACSTAPLTEVNPNEIPQVQGSSSDRETIVILGTNDIHGQLAPMSLKSKEADGVPPITYEAAGAAALSGVISAIQREFGEHLLWLDAGDEFQGTIESNSQKGAPMVEFFNLKKLQAAAIGNHEFDFGALTETNPDRLSSLKARMSEAKYPYLSANIFDKKTNHLYPFPNTFPSVIKQIGRLKVGIIGLTTRDTPTTTFPINVKELFFGDLKAATVKEAKILREKGAQVIVVTMHAGLHCNLGKSSLTHMIRKPNDSLGDCNSQEEVVQWLKALPPHTVDAVVSGHSHSIVHHWLPEGPVSAGSMVPVIQGGASSRYVNLIYLTYDLKEGKLLKDQTRIEGPIPVCPKVFANQGDCNGEKMPPKNGRGPLVTPMFRGKEIQPDPATLEFLKPVFARSEEIKAKEIGFAANRIDHNRMKESAMANLVADAMRKHAQTDFAFVNSGGVRTGMEPGKITYGDVFRVSPFDNAIVRLKVTGKELKLMLRNLENGSRGFHSVSGLILRLIDLKYDAPSNDLDHNGKIEPWEINRLIETRTADGETIHDDKFYSLATVDFLLLGGDDMKWSMSGIPQDRIDMGDGVLLRDAVAKHIQEARGATINTEEFPLVDPKHPRLIFENPDVKKKKAAKTPKKKAKGSKKKRR